MRIILIGGGKVGYYLAKTLLERGYELTVLEQEQRIADQRANELDNPVICGDGTTVEALERADARNADALIAVTGSDEDNLVCCQLGKSVFGIKKVIGKVNDPKNVEIFERLGVDIAISGTETIVTQLEREVDTSKIKELLEVGDDASIGEIELPEQYPLSGVPLFEIKLPQNSIIIAIKRNKKLIIPRGNTKLWGGDTLTVMAKDHAVKELLKTLRIEEA